MEEDLSKELDLQIKGAEEPSLWELIGIRVILLPYTVAKVSIGLALVYIYKPIALAPPTKIKKQKNPQT